MDGESPQEFTFLFSAKADDVDAKEKFIISHSKLDEKSKEFADRRGIKVIEYETTSELRGKRQKEFLCQR